MSVREKILGAEARWVMGRVMAGDFSERNDPFDKIEQRFAAQQESG